MEPVKQNEQRKLQGVRAWVYVYVDLCMHSVLQMCLYLFVLWKLSKQITMLSAVVSNHIPKDI